MSDFESRHMIEALRSGVPSRAVGAYFSSSRGEFISKVENRLDDVIENGKSDSIIYSGRYGEGKTHMLNTIFELASSRGMAVTFIPLSLETPLGNSKVLYSKVMQNTYLPGASQPGVFRNFEGTFTKGSEKGKDALKFAFEHLETDRLYHVFENWMNAEDAEDHFMMQTDLEGDYVSTVNIKAIHKKCFGTTLKFESKFLFSRHMMDYFSFMSHLLGLMGCKGWVLLFDEAELIGRLAKMSRKKAYLGMEPFLFPDGRLENVMSVFAFSSSFAEDVLDGRGDLGFIRELEKEDPEKKILERVTDRIMRVEELTPLTEDDLRRSIADIISLHEAAFDWISGTDADTMLPVVKKFGYLLRTKIRAAIEYLDQLYFYGSASGIKTGELMVENLSESLDDDPSLKEIIDSI